MPPAMRTLHVVIGAPHRDLPPPLTDTAKLNEHDPENQPRYAAHIPTQLLRTSSLNFAPKAHASAVNYTVQCGPVVGDRLLLIRPGYARAFGPNLLAFQETFLHLPFPRKHKNGSGRLASCRGNFSGEKTASIEGFVTDNFLVSGL